MLKQDDGKKAVRRFRVIRTAFMLFNISVSILLIMMFAMRLF